MPSRETGQIAFAEEPYQEHSMGNNRLQLKERNPQASLVDTEKALRVCEKRANLLSDLEDSYFDIF